MDKELVGVVLEGTKSGFGALDIFTKHLQHHFGEAFRDSYTQNGRRVSSSSIRSDNLGATRNHVQTE